MRLPPDQSFYTSSLDVCRESCWLRLGHILVADQVQGRALEDEAVSIFCGRLAEWAGGINLELVEDRRETNIRMRIGFH